MAAYSCGVEHGQAKAHAVVCLDNLGQWGLATQLDVDHTKKNAVERISTSVGDSL